MAASHSAVFRSQEAISRRDMVVTWPRVILEEVVRTGQILDKVVKEGFVDGLDVYCEKMNN